MGGFETHAEEGGPTLSEPLVSPWPGRRDSVLVAAGEARSAK